MDRSAFLREFEQSGLSADDGLRRRIHDHDAVALDGKQLAKTLVQEDLLTPFQANQLLNGKGKDLQFGPYTLIERLGGGGQGQVYKARHRKLGRVVALKALPKELAGDEAALARFKSEIEATARVAHPNIVVAFDADEINGLLVLAMEFIDGADLDRLVREGGPLPIDLACHCIRQAALGLAHAHRLGMIHRDVKPSNILLQTLSDRDVPAVWRGQGVVYGNVKVLDLGLARFGTTATAPEGEPPERITELNQIMGTPDFMAPEQARASRKADHRCDIYSLGATFYFCLAGRPPFPDGPPMEKLLKHQIEEPAPIGEIRPETPAVLASLIRRMMAKDPSQRPQTVIEVAEALVAFQTERRVAASNVAGKDPDEPPSELTFAGSDSRLLALRDDQPSRRDRLVWALATLAVLNLGLIAVLIIRALTR